MMKSLSKAKGTGNSDPLEIVALLGLFICCHTVFSKYPLYCFRVVTPKEVVVAGLAENKSKLLDVMDCPKKGRCIVAKEAREYVTEYKYHMMYPISDKKKRSMIAMTKAVTFWMYRSPIRKVVMPECV